MTCTFRPHHDSLYTSSSSSSLLCITAWESSSFWHWLLHWHISVHAKYLALQEHLPEEQSVLHLHWIISRMAFGAGRTSVVIGFSVPSECLKYPFCRGSNCGSCRAMAACAHTLVWTWALKVCCFKAPSVGGSLSFSALCLQKRCHRSWGIVLIMIPLGE